VTTDSEPVREYARTSPKHWINLQAEDVPQGWIDDMVKRLFEELNRQMLRMEHAHAKERKEDDDADKREQDSLTLARLEGTLNRLTRLEMQRADLRATKTARKRRDVRAAIRSKVLGAIERSRAENRDGESQ